MGNPGRRSPCQSAAYRIRVEGALPSAFGEIYANLAVIGGSTERGFTISEISGRFADQTALHSLLNYLYDSDQVLLSVEEIGPAGSPEPTSRRESP